MEPVKEKKVKIARTRNGIPCLWESYIVFADLRRATAIFGKDRKSKTAVYVNKEKDKQALIPVQEGDFISKAFEDKNGVALSVFKIESISSMDNSAIIVPVYRKSSLVSEYAVDELYKEMVEMTMSKLTSNQILSKIPSKIYSDGPKEKLQG